MNNQNQLRAMQYVREGMYMTPEFVKKLLDETDLDKYSSIAVLYSVEMLPALKERGVDNVTLVIDNNKKYIKNFCASFGYTAIEYKEVNRIDMKFDLVIGNPPFTLQTKRGDGKLTNKSGVREFLSFSMDVADEVVFVAPCHFCAPIQKESSAWKKLREQMNGFGVEEIRTFEQRKWFPTVSFHNAGIIHLKHGASGQLEDFDSLFGEDIFFEADEYLDTQRGVSKGTYPESEDGKYRVVVRMKNDGSDDFETVRTESIRVVNSDWFVTVQEQSGAAGIKSAIVFDNTKRDWGVASNVHPLYANTEEEAKKIAEWVKTERFNEMLMKVTRGERVVRGGWLKKLPKYDVE